MLLENSNIYREVLKVLNGGPNPVHWYWEAVLHANGLDIPIYKVVTMDLTRDYANSFADAMMVECLIAPGDYDFRVWPYKDNLELTLYRRPLSETNGNPTLGSKTQTQRYSVTLSESSGAVVENNNVTDSNPDLSNLRDYKTIHIQLLDKVVQRIRFNTIGGIFRNSSPLDTIRALLMELSKSSDVDGDISVAGVDVAPRGNTTIRDHIIIKDGTRLTYFPRYIHENCGGVYSNGFGYYLQNGIWYLYPLYDLGRYNVDKRPLVLLNVPANRLKGVERTYRVTANQIIVVGNGKTKQIDMSEQAILNAGSGTRFGIASRIMDSFVSVNGNKATASKDNNTSSFVLEQRKDNLSFVTLSSAHITDNIAMEMSKLSARNGTFIMVEWEHADSSVIYPGMPLKYVYEENKNVHELNGIVTNSHYFTSLNSATMQGGHHTTTALLTVFVDKAILIGLTLSNAPT